MTASGFTPKMRARMQDYLCGMELAAAKGRGYFAECVLHSSPESLEADAGALRALLAEVEKNTLRGHRLSEIAELLVDRYSSDGRVVHGAWNRNALAHIADELDEMGRVLRHYYPDGAAPDGAASPETDVGPQPKEVMPPESRQRSRLDVSGDSVGPSVSEAGPPATNGERLYPCDKCGRTRTAAEGGTVFTVCDDCWDADRVAAAPLSDALSGESASRPDRLVVGGKEWMPVPSDAERAERERLALWATKYGEALGCGDGPYTEADDLLTIARILRGGTARKEG